MNSLKSSINPVANSLPHFTIGYWASEKLGNHRALISVPVNADAVKLRIPWRRRDRNPEQKKIIVTEYRTGEQVQNVIPIDLNQEFGDIVFQPKKYAPGFHFVYYMPFELSDNEWFPESQYIRPDNLCDESWLERNGLRPDKINGGQWRELPSATLVEIQARREIDSFYPMEVIATEKEKRELIVKNEEKPFLLFPESVEFPIKMFDNIPFRWIDKGPADKFVGKASRNEFYVFQIGLWALKNLKNVNVKFNNLTFDKANIPKQNFNCFNLEGTDWLGSKYGETINVDGGDVLPLWIGVQIPANAPSAIYTGTVSIKADGYRPVSMPVSIQVTEDFLDDCGDLEINKLSKLRWLDLTKGKDDRPISPFVPLKVKNKTIQCLGRSITIGHLGLPLEMTSTFSPNNNETNYAPTEILADEVRFVIENNNTTLTLDENQFAVVEKNTGSVKWEAKASNNEFDYHCLGGMSYDGFIDFKISLTPKSNCDIEDIRIEIPLLKSQALYMMGMGFKGGIRPGKWEWTWNEKFVNHQVWLGKVNAGINIRLKHKHEDCAPYNLHNSGPYQDWSNNGLGGCEIHEEGNDKVILKAYSGKRRCGKGKSLSFNFSLLTTPVKPLNPDHWDNRYFHKQAKSPFSPYAVSVETAQDFGANIINIHHGFYEVNKYLNYPFINLKKLAEYVENAHEKGLKVKLYYTIRELSNHAKELWAFRALGNEIFGTIKDHSLADLFDENKTGKNSAGKGHAWLWEHMISDYTSAWHCHFSDGSWDVSLAVQQKSRLLNFYVAGLEFLIKHTDIDGIYIDGIDCDHEIMKRIRSVAENVKPGFLIDLHSGNTFQPDYGLVSPASKYMEHFPFIDSIWFGEGYDYNESPDYWLIEISGIPFGLFGEMLEGGGNPWRGMIYGMTGRLGWINCYSSPHMWKVWDEFGIQDAKMIGYWDPECPVKTNDENLPATVYLKKDKIMVAIASWAPKEIAVKLDINWRVLGLNPKKTILHAPEIGAGFQPEKTFLPNDELLVVPGRGWLLMIREKK